MNGYSNPKTFVFTVSMFHWLIDQLGAELDGSSDEIVFGVIPVCYMGCYPAIGVRLRDESRRGDVEVLVQEAVDRILRDRSALEYLEYVQDPTKDWHQITADLMRTGGVVDPGP